MICSECQKREVHVKKRGLCFKCYQRLRTKHGAYKDRPDWKQRKITTYSYDSKLMVYSDEQSNQICYENEMEFVKNYFEHSNWVHRPGRFKVYNRSYHPDFYDGERNVFIEVAATRQAYHQNKNKYKQFKEVYPKINLEVRTTDGRLLEDKPKGEKWTHGKLKIIRRKVDAQENKKIA